MSETKESTRGSQPEHQEPVNLVRPKLPFHKSVEFALSGVTYVLRSERNARIESAIALIALALGIGLQISAVEWAIILTLIGGVLAVELLNTAIESAVDLASPEYHLLAKRAKDTAAGAVLVMAVSSICVGIAIFGPRLWRMVQTLF